MKDKYIIFYTIFFSLYSILNFYIGKVIFKGLKITTNISPLPFWIAFCALASSYIASMALTKYLPYRLNNFFSFIGSYWLGLLMYGSLIFPILGLINLILKKSSLLNNKIYIMETVLMSIVFIIFIIIGTYNANNSYVKSFDIDIEKDTLKEPLNIVMVSDLHLGNIMKNNRLKSMVTEINELNPDLVIIAGDIIDSDITPFLNHNMAVEFSNIKSKYGTFATLGNHDVLTKEEDTIVDILKENSITVLRDESVLINDDFYIIGRDDITVNRYGKEDRATLEGLTKDLDSSKPLIVIDHNPQYINESLNANIDLQLSGHTHKGQILPGNLVTNKIFEVDYGYLKKDNLNVIVSSGYGTWGPPLRLGSRSEIVQIKLK
ncbi:MAG: metallophosphoesterase [Clostridium sp.]|uniref:metallophosphoesterase n=1 Tax=Clostridium sp. TaxID=1506 RepID=UPI0025C60D22|nr:metallophosphoesterase [Clostridium sp.]MCF0148977.1 metallophosphoesterase [Clostridium sp.]